VPLTKSAQVQAAIARAVALRGCAVMGILNPTPDSFSDGGMLGTVAAACGAVDQMIAAGADIVDVGGESTRPGAHAVSAPEQLRRVLDVVRYASTRILTSIDTSHADVAQACLAAGASIVNDVRCAADAELLRVTAEARAAYVLSHARPDHGNMRAFSKYPEDAYGVDVVATVTAELRIALRSAVAAGIDENAIVLDPGLGFSKSAQHSFALLLRMDALVASFEQPVLVGASRKSFLAEFSPSAAPSERIGASIGCALVAAQRGAKLVRVHDVRDTCQALAVQYACLRGGATAHSERPLPEGDGGRIC
jgi:dihydropteroate synthase